MQKVENYTNGTPQGSVCRPILFNMINEIFNNIDFSISKHYADHESLWVRGGNINNLKNKMQSAMIELIDGHMNGVLFVC